MGIFNNVRAESENGKKYLVLTPNPYMKLLNLAILLLILLSGIIKIFIKSFLENNGLIILNRAVYFYGNPRLDI